MITFLICLAIHIVLGIIIISILERSSEGSLPTPSFMFFIAVIFWWFIVYGIASEYVEYWWKNRKSN